MNLSNILQETDLTKIYLEQFKLSTTPSFCIIFNFKSSKFGMIINANNKLKQALSLWGGRKEKESFIFRNCWIFPNSTLYKIKKIFGILNIKINDLRQNKNICASRAKFVNNSDNTTFTVMSSHDDRLITFWKSIEISHNVVNIKPNSFLFHSIEFHRIIPKIHLQATIDMLHHSLNYKIKFCGLLYANITKIDNNLIQLQSPFVNSSVLREFFKDIQTYYGLSFSNKDKTTPEKETRIIPIKYHLMVHNKMIQTGYPILFTNFQD